MKKLTWIVLKIDFYFSDFRISKDFAYTSLKPKLKAADIGVARTKSQENGFVQIVDF